jgi:hypothetical protein
LFFGLDIRFETKMDMYKQMQVQSVEDALNIGLPAATEGQTKYDYTKFENQITIVTLTSWTKS